MPRKQTLQLNQAYPPIEPDFIGWGLFLQQVWLLWAFSQILEYLAQAKQILSQ